MRKKFDVYSTLSERHELRLYEDAIRSLFNLPKRQGKITGVSLHGSGVQITFEKTAGKCKTVKFI